MKIKQNVVATIAIWFMTTAAYAADTGPMMPWDTPLQRVQQVLTGSIAHAIIVIAIALSGIMFAVGDHGSALRKTMGIVFGGAIAMGAATIYTSLGFSGAMV